MIHARRLSFLMLVALLPACGGGSGAEPGVAGEPIFLIPPEMPLDGRGGLNQRPPADLLDEQLVPLAARRPGPLTTDDRDAAETQGLEAAREHMKGRGFGPNDDVEVKRVQRDEFGGLHVKMCQTHRGVPILGAGIAWHAVPDRPTSISDNLVTGLDVDVEPAVVQLDAVRTAETRYAGRDNTDPGVPTDSNARLAIRAAQDWVRVRTTHAVDHTDDFERQVVDARLVWVILVAPALPTDEEIIQTVLDDPPGADSDDAATDAARRANPVRGGQGPEEGPESETHMLDRVLQPAVRYLVDAQTGDVIEEKVLVENDDFVAAEGTGYSRLSGVVPVSVAYRPDNDTYYLMDVSRPDTGNGPMKIGSWVLDANNVATHDPSEMYWINDWNNVWGDSSIFDSEGSALNTARRQTPAVDVAHGVQMTWDFLDHVLAVWGPAGDGTRTKACVHYDDGYGDAHYNPSSQFICFGDGSTISGPGNYSLGTVAHELGHAFWHASGIESESGEASALNEGGGDIQGGLVQLYRATGRGLGTQVRRFPHFANWRWRVVNPDGYDEEEEGVTYPGLSYWSASLEDGPPHVGGLPFGRAMVYLAEGAPTDPANTLWTTEFPNGLGGIGITRAAHIWHYAMAYCVVGSPDYPDMRAAFLGAAQLLYGVGSMADRAVRRAFAGIRVGSSWGDPNPPGIAYAQVFDVNTKDMTAAIFAIPTDDTGFRELRVDGHGNNGHYEGDIFLGFASITRAPVGMSDFTFTIEDSAGTTTSVQRSFLKPRDRNLIVNGDFEDDMAGWTTDSGQDRVSSFAGGAFIGNRYLIMAGDDRAWQDVTIPPQAENVSLVFRVLVRDSATDLDSLRVTVQDPMGGVVQTLATYDRDTPADTRNWVNKGYLRQEIDMSAFAGQTIRLAFDQSATAGQYRFAVDQVVMTYEEDVTVGLPQVEVAEYDDTVSFTLPDIVGVPPAEIGRVDWIVDGAFVGAGQIASNDYYGSYFASALTPGAHWVGGRVRGLDNSILADSIGVWFETGLPVHELLPDGGFESGAWDLTYGDPPPKIQVIPNGTYPKTPFQGAKAIKMGGLGADDVTRVGVEVQMPAQMATLTLSVRVDTISDEDSVDDTPEDDDSLWVEFWDLSNYTKIGEYMVARFNDQFIWPGTQHGWRGYVRKEVSIPTWALAGKYVMVRLFTKETPTKATTFFVDNASLRYTEYGLNFGD